MRFERRKYLCQHTMTTPLDCRLWLPCYWKGFLMWNDNLSPTFTLSRLRAHLQCDRGRCSRMDFIQFLRIHSDQLVGSPEVRWTRSLIQRLVCSTPRPLTYWNIGLGSGIETPLFFCILHSRCSLFKVLIILFHW